jgi:predicted alpha/beta superfamily hydrolase
MTATATTPLLAGVSYEVRSRSEGEARRINVWTPPGYHQQPDRRYPVLYLLDGGVNQDFLPVVGLAALGGLNGATEEMIVVGVESGPGMRVRDFTTRSTVPAELKDFPLRGQSALFRRFLADELKPFIDSAFRTTGVTGLIGESLAAYFVVDTCLRAPHLFTRCLAISPSLWWDDERLSREAAALLKARRQGQGSLYLAIANEGGAMQTGMDRLVAALKAGAPPELAWTYEPFPEERHHTIYHPAGLRALRWAFPGPEAIK